MKIINQKSMNRCWSISTKPGSNNVALGYDEGTVIVKMGRETPAASMDASGKIYYAVHSHILSTQLRSGADGVSDSADGELLV